MNLFKNEIKIIPIDKIQPNKINPNHMPNKTFLKLKASLTKFGMMLPIVVRKLDKGNYEIIDGEWRYRASIGIGLNEILCNIIDIKEKDVAKYILASTIKGKHNLYETLDIVEKLQKTADKETLDACNLDKLKLERRVKYHGSDKIKLIKRTDSKRDEKDGTSVKSVEDYKKVIVIPIEEYNRLKALDK